MYADMYVNIARQSANVTAQQVHRGRRLDGAAMLENSSGNNTTVI